VGKEKIAITLDERFVSELDRLVEKHVFQSRGQAIQEAVGGKLLRMKRTRLAEESAYFAELGHLFGMKTAGCSGKPATPC